MTPLRFFNNLQRFPRLRNFQKIHKFVFFIYIKIIISSCTTHRVEISVGPNITEKYDTQLSFVAQNGSVFSISFKCQP